MFHAHLIQEVTGSIPYFVSYLLYNKLIVFLCRTDRRRCRTLPGDVCSMLLRMDEEKREEMKKIRNTTIGVKLTHLLLAFDIWIIIKIEI
jgi:hypothetical protein